MCEMIGESIETHQVLDDILFITIDLLQCTLHLNLDDRCFINYLLLCCIIFGACHCHKIYKVLPRLLPLVSENGLLLFLMALQRIVQYVLTAAILFLYRIVFNLKCD